VRYEELYGQSIEDPQGVWQEQAKAIHWRKPPATILDYSNPPFRRWFVGGRDQSLLQRGRPACQSRPDQTALVVISTETECELARSRIGSCIARSTPLKPCSVAWHRHRRPRRHLNADMAEAVLRHARLRAHRGDHSVVFGGLRRLHNLALRIGRPTPKLLICADAGMRGGKVISTSRWSTQPVATARPRRRRTC